ncbi:MAG: 3-dehydroquinate synthase [Ruminococcaceae bacterium]|nr:3-dehydroquinate synthase [Oscillospiraceae bacterium]
MRIPVKTATGGYEIVLKRGCLSRAGELLNLARRVAVVTDDGVPAEYAKAVADAAESAVIITLPQGEASKNIENYQKILKTLVEEGFTRTDCVVAVGGGVVGDLAGFAAATFMRGIDFYNVPTTVLSQVDSSIGGKTAIDFEGYKNIVGAFWPPKRVLIDPETLLSLPRRQISNGLAEAVKMSLTSDAELFEIFEQSDPYELLDTIIERSLLIKKKVVEEDEKEAGLRKILNFGHTVAHAIETENAMQNYYHGECVAMGMLYMCSPAVRERLLPVLSKLSLPTLTDFDEEGLLKAIRHDKKMAGSSITVVYVSAPGIYELKKMTLEQLEKVIREVKG